MDIHAAFISNLKQFEQRLGIGLNNLGVGKFHAIA